MERLGRSLVEILMGRLEEILGRSLVEIMRRSLVEILGEGVNGDIKRSLVERRGWKEFGVEIGEDICRNIGGDNWRLE